MIVIVERSYELKMMKVFLSLVTIHVVLSAAGVPFIRYGLPSEKNSGEGGLPWNTLQLPEPSAEYQDSKTLEEKNSFPGPPDLEQKIASSSLIFDKVVIPSTELELPRYKYNQGWWLQPIERNRPDSEVVVQIQSPSTNKSPYFTTHTEAPETINQQPSIVDVRFGNDASEPAPYPSAQEPVPYPPAAEPAPYPPAVEPAPYPPASEPAPYPPASEPAPYPPASEPAPYPPASEPAPYPSAQEPVPYPPAAEPAPYPPASEPAPYPSAQEPVPYPPASEPAPYPPASEPAPYPPAAESAPYPPASEPAPYPPAFEPAPYPSAQEPVPYPPAPEPAPYPPASEPAPYPAAAEPAPYPSAPESGPYQYEYPPQKGIGLLLGEKGSDIDKVVSVPSGESQAPSSLPALGVPPAGVVNGGEESGGSSIQSQSLSGPGPGTSNSLVIPTGTNVKVQDKYGQYSHGFANPDGTQIQETGHLISTDNGWEYVIAQEGSYSYLSPEGYPIYVRYIADDKGFRILSQGFSAR